MASGCLSLWFADEISRCVEAMKDDQLISPALKDELGMLKSVVSYVRAGFLYAEGSSQLNKGLKAEVSLNHIYELEQFLCGVDKKVNDLFCWVRETKRERKRSTVKRFQMEINEQRKILELLGERVFDGIGITVDSYFVGDSEGESSHGKSKDEIIQSLIPPFVRRDRQKELLKSIGRGLLFQNDDDNPHDVAINILRNIFYFKYSSFYRFWVDDEADVNRIFPERVINDLSTRLMQRYALLPLHLKYCFDYCSLFPMDCVIEVPVLVQLWMAQGFIIHEDEHADEDVGYCYFEELLNKGFFQQVESDVLDQSRATKCRMDSHAFALSAITSGSRYVLLRSNGQNYIEGAFHVSCDFHLYSERQIPKAIIRRDFELIRSFLLPGQSKSKYDQGLIDAEKIYNIISPDPDSGWKHKEEIKPESVSDLLISVLRGLYALELHDLGIQKLPDNIGGRLKHLRYLDVSGNPDIKLLPNSITNLVHLQMLKLSSCFGLQELPKDIKKLINLRHLEIDGCHNLSCMPPELGQLTNLCTLSKFVLINEVDPRGLEELGKLNNLRGELQIKNLTASLGNACRSASLESKQHLQSLILDWAASSPASDQFQIQLDDLKPHMNLKRLTLRGYGGLRLSSWLQSLSSLCILVLDNMPNLEYIANEGGGLQFPLLRELWLTELPQLKRWGEDEVELQSLPPFPCLSRLFIQDCPNLVSIPLFPTLEEELMLDSTSLKPFQETLTILDSGDPVSPPLSKLKELSLVGIDELTYSKANEIPWQALTSLCVLKLDYLINLDKLPSNLKHLANLKELHIRRCKMKSLPEWIKVIKSLEKLAIWACPYLESLPEETHNWKVEPILTSLKTLEIEDCPTLLQRCQKKTGADWDKIKHIPNLLGDLKKQENSCRRGLLRAMASHIVGYPRMGPKRELKFALESFWDGKSSAEDLQKVAADLRSSIWNQMAQAGIKYIPSNTFSYYDQVLDTTAMLGAVPPRYGWNGGEIGFDVYFSMARGNATVPAMEMTKWFDTNYHYIVPELGPEVKFSYASHKAVEEFREAKALGVETVPVLVGPVSYLLLSKPAKGVEKSFSLLSLIANILPIYKDVVAELKVAGATWIQFDEPTLVKDLESHQLQAFAHAYSELESSLSGLNVLIETYFADVPAEAFKTLTSLKGVTGYGFDLVRGTKTLDLIKGGLPSGKYLFAGVVDGRNIWANDLASSLSTLQDLEGIVGKDKIVVSTSCSLLHTAVDLVNETTLDQEIKSWLAFASQKVVEVNALAKALFGHKNEAFFSPNAEAQASRKSSPWVSNEAVQKAAAALKGSDHRRATNVSARLDSQQKKLNLPILPTTTNGSFPQTLELRRVRSEYKAKKISEEEYVNAIKEEINKVVKLQEELDIDVLVHGEPERNDMVEYFGEQLSGFAFTVNGWVQSYGSRCVKPPIIYGDVSRPNPMTVSWSSLAQSMTKRPMKGMLTGPVTILNWSFVRNDQPRSETCYQIALAIKHEVEDLEKAGITVIQIDEAALREGLPLRKSEVDYYLDWAVHSFRITNCGVQDTTQIHTHMCYSNFNDIIHSIINMDADVITIENSRSDEKLLSVFREGLKYGAGIGPGVYDIHSPRIPSTDEIADRINKMLAVLESNILWVNPDCGLKTRKYKEVKPALSNMVAAAKLLRTQLASAK